MSQIEAIQCDGCGTLIAANQVRTHGAGHWMLGAVDYITSEREKLDTADVCNDCIGRWFLDDRAARQRTLGRLDNRQSQAGRVGEGRHHESSTPATAGWLASKTPRFFRPS
jgi:hypothetical protein